MNWQFNDCENCLWDEYCTKYDMTRWIDTNLYEEDERYECDKYTPVGDEKASQYLSDLIMRQGYYDRSSQECMGFVNVEELDKMQRQLREYGL